ADAAGGNDTVRRLCHRQGFGRRGDARHLAILLRDVYGADDRDLRALAVAGVAEGVRVLGQARPFAGRGDFCMEIVDLSRELYHRTPTYPGHPPVMHGVWKTHEESFVDSGNVHGLASMFISMVDHAGTHIDAPRHFGKSGISIDEYPLEKCIVPGICIDLRHIAPRAEITPADLEAAVAKAGVPVPKGGTVLLCTGHHERTFPRKEYSSDNSGV